MPRSDEAEMWFSAVYKAVQEVPYGRVTSYGHIATLIGYRMRPARSPNICNTDINSTTTATGWRLPKASPVVLRSAQC